MVDPDKKLEMIEQLNIVMTYSDYESNVSDAKFENLIELEKDFGFKLPSERKGNYTIEEYNEDYTYKTINRVLYIYEKDFINLGYSQEFKYLTV